MSLWWIPAGIAAWFLIAIVVGLCIGPVLGRCSQAREAAGQQRMRAPDARHAAARKDRQVSPGWLSGSSAIARREQNVTL
jgi:hypothetical protein